MQTMENEVNAQGAARITGRNERTIRKHIADGSLPARRTHYDWRIRVEDLQARYGTYHKPVTEPKLTPKPARIIAITRKRNGFRSHEEAARWLADHGVNALTPKNWKGWRQVALTHADILGFALSLQATKNYRRTWRLRRCGRSSCVCESML